MGTSNIEWTNETWNPLVGCSKQSAGCRNCYAEAMGKRLRAMALADVEAGRNLGRKRAYLDAVDKRGRWTGRVVTLPEALGDPLRWRTSRRVFVNSMSDLFHPTVPFEFIAAVFGVMAACPQHTFQVLTKHPARAAEFFAWAGAFRWPGGGGVGPFAAMGHALAHQDANFPESWDVDEGPNLGDAWPLPNVWLGCSVEDQSTADERIPELLECPAAVRFVSYEPALGPVDFTALDYCGHRLNAMDRTTSGRLNAITLDWVIVGGESGPCARPFDVAWARSTIEQCKAAGVACFVKQLGARPFIERGGELRRGRFGSYGSSQPEWWRAGGSGPAGGRWIDDAKGGDPAEWPEELRVREWPKP